MKQKILLGISGGIAAVKTQELIEKFKEKYDVVVVMTAGAGEIISPQQIKDAYGVEVYVNLFENPIDTRKILLERKVEHIQVAGSASTIVIAPATANIIAKLANGIADDYLSTIALAATCPIVICPSMNVHMWHHPATQENIQKLKNIGYQIIDPDSGMLACGYEGQGRLASSALIIEEVDRLLSKTLRLAGKKIIVTAGGTREPIDAVRFIGNKSSGKMGVAIAEECFLQGGQVVLIRAKTAISPRYNIKQIIFETADELEGSIKKELMHADFLFHVAAVSDFRINKQKGKISSDEPSTLTLIPREKILNKVKLWNAKTVVIAFKAETGKIENLLQKARDRMKKTNIDGIIANIVNKTSGFEVDTNEVYILKNSGETTHIPLNSKRNIAKKIVENII